MTKQHLQGVVCAQARCKPPAPRKRCTQATCSARRSKAHAWASMLAGGLLLVPAGHHSHKNCLCRVLFTMLTHQHDIGCPSWVHHPWHGSFCRISARLQAAGGSI